MSKHIQKDTRTHLVAELLLLPQCAGTKIMIVEALAGEYHDYKNVKYDCGKMASSSKLRALGHVLLAKRIEEGEFDESADAEDCKMMKAELLGMGLSTEQCHEHFGV